LLKVLRDDTLSDLSRTQRIQRFERRGEMMQISQLSFEAAFAELEETVQKLEAGDLTLEDSLALFERGQALAAHCQKQLDAAELKVQQLRSTPQGEVRAVDFEVQE